MILTCGLKNKNTRSPSQRQLSGFCLPMLCSDITTFWEWDEKRPKQLKCVKFKSFHPINKNKIFHWLFGASVKGVGICSYVCICNFSPSWVYCRSFEVMWQWTVWLCPKKLLQGQQLMPKHPVVWIQLLDEEASYLMSKTNKAREVSPTMLKLKHQCLCRAIKRQK